MKRTISKLMIVILAVLSISSTAFASSDNPEIDIEYFEDGSYMVTYIEDESSAPGIALLSTSTATKSKTAKYYDSTGKALWYVKVTGTFSYNKKTATCTKSSVTAGIYDTSWKISSKSSSKSGNTATAKATAKHYYSGNVTKTKSKTVKLSCSPSGKFS